MLINNLLWIETMNITKDKHASLHHIYLLWELKHFNFLRKIIFLLFLAASPYKLHAKVRLLCSSALTSQHFEFHKAQYIKSFDILNQYGYRDFYIIEALAKKGPTFLDEYSNHVFYAQTNNAHLRNKGINEAKTILEALLYYKCDNDDIIIKMTGRYHWLSNDFFTLVENHQDVDAIVKCDSTGQVHTLAYAMRCKHFIAMFQQMNYEFMEAHMVNLEYEVAQYIKRKVAEGNFKVIICEKLHIEANLHGSSASPGAEGIIIF